MRGLSTEGNFHLKIDWASLIVGRKFTAFALFYFVFEGNFQVQAPPPPHRGGLIFWRGDLTEGFLRYEFWGLMFGGAYFRNFTVPVRNNKNPNFEWRGWVQVVLFSKYGTPFADSDSSIFVAELVN